MNNKKFEPNYPQKLKIQMSISEFYRSKVNISKKRIYRSRTKNYY
jgi:hypothetical protein